MLSDISQELTTLLEADYGEDVREAIKDALSKINNNTIPTVDVTGVKGDSESEYRKGNINITKANIGLSNVDNTSDMSKPVSNAQQQALSKKIGVSNLKGAVAIQKYLTNAIGCLNSFNKSVDALTLYGKSIQNGIPSSDNPVNIINAGSSGSIKLCSVGRNLADMSLITASTSNDGVHDEIEVYGVQVTSSNGTVSFSGTATDTVIVRGLIITLPVGMYKLSGCPSGGSTESYRVEVRTTDTTVLSRDYGEGNEFEITEPTQCRVCIRIASGYNATGMSIHPILSLSSIVTNETTINVTVNIPTPNGLLGVPVEESGTYIDDDGQQWICDTIDKVSGIYTKRCGYIASYNNETINGSWLSSMDTYSENSTPSVGASVVYCLDEPVVSQLSFSQLTALDKVQSHDEYTLMFIKDAVIPNMYAEIYVDIPKTISDDNVAIDFNGFATKILHINDSDVTILAEANTRYICGEVSTLECTPPNSGIVDIIFTSGSSKTILTLPNTVKMPDWFEVEANMTYEISIMDGVYGVVTSWAV